MDYQSFDWQCTDGTRMAASEWRPSNSEQQPVAVIGFVHGMGEHMGRYHHVAEMLTEEGYVVLGFDQRGHGKTDGRRGHTPKYEALLEGVDRMLEEAKERYPGAPVFLYGHSMGGNVLLNYLLRRKPDIAGAVVSGPWLKLAFAPPQVQVVVGRLIERIYPTYTNNRPMNANHLTSDPVMVERYRQDPLGHGRITARFFFGVHRAGLWALNHADQLAVPILLMHGGDDSVTSIAASRIFAERAGKLCEFQEWPGFKHELHNELDRADVFATVKSWLTKRLEAISH